MSRIAKQPVMIPEGVEADVSGSEVVVRGSKGSLQRTVHSSVSVEKHESSLLFSLSNEKINSWAQAGTERALINNMVVGVSQGYQKALRLVGVGFRAQLTGKHLNLILGYSHDINFAVPEGIQIEVPSLTEVVVKGIDKQLVGQTSAKIRAFRPPEPYKGKGVRYADEVVRRKEVKKS